MYRIINLTRTRQLITFAFNSNNQTNTAARFNEEAYKIANAVTQNKWICIDSFIRRSSTGDWIFVIRGPLCQHKQLIEKKRLTGSFGVIRRPLIASHTNNNADLNELFYYALRGRWNGTHLTQTHEKHIWHICCQTFHVPCEMSQSACEPNIWKRSKSGLSLLPFRSSPNSIKSRANGIRCVCDKAVLIFYVFLLDMVSARACGFIRMPANIGLYGIPSAIRPLFV